MQGKNISGIHATISDFYSWFWLEIENIYFLNLQRTHASGGLLRDARGFETLNWGPTKKPKYTRSSNLKVSAGVRAGRQYGKYSLKINTTAVPLFML